MPNTLSFNVGSSSLKLAFYQASECLFTLSIDIKQQTAHYTGNVPHALHHWQPTNVLSDNAYEVFRAVYQQYDVLPVVVHRVVHGGYYQQPVIINPQVLEKLQALAPLCPLHQPPALAVIQRLAQAFAHLTQIAAFDTTFHSQQAALSYSYALPLTLREQGIRAYGFHGLSCQSIMRQLLTIDSKLATGKVLIAHLGNGSSVTAVVDGVSQANSMGFSSLEGLPMGTRCGHIDAGVLLYLLAQGWNATKLTQLLYKESGLLGLSGISSDMRELINNASPQANFAIDYFCKRTAQEIASLATAIGGIDRLIFTGGIGEHQALVRANILQHLAWLGILLDTKANQTHERCISTSKSSVAVFIINTDEQYELYLAAQVLAN